MLSFGFKHLRAVPLYCCVLLLLTNTIFAQKAPTKQPFEIKLDETEEYFLENDMRISAVTGFPLAIYNAQYSVRPGTAEEMAEQYLRGNVRLLGLKQENLSDLRHQMTRTSQLGYTVRYHQYYNGIPVYKADMAITINKNNVVNNIANGYRSNVTVKDINPSISAATAKQVAYAYIGVQGNINFEKDRLVIYSINGKSRLAYEIKVISAKPGGEWAVFVDAKTQEIFKAEDITFYYNHPSGEHKHDHSHGRADKTNAFVDGTGNIFDPDPLSSATVAYGTGGYTDGNDVNTPDLNSQLMSVTLYDIDLTAGVYTLNGLWAHEVDWDTPNDGIVSQTTDDFSYNREDDEFEAVNTYYHIDWSMRYMNDTLGCNIRPYQYTTGVQFDPHGADEQDNSFYTSGSGQLSFGEGCVDDGEDSDVIHHELGHGIHDWITGGNLSQVEGLSEGCGDYWAQSYNRYKGYWTPADPQYNWIFNWDGHNDCWAGRVSDFPGTYPGNLSGAIHNQGQVWSTCMMEVWNEIGQHGTDKIFLEGLGMTGGNTNQNDAANAVYQAAIDLGYTQAEIVTINATLTACGYTLPSPPGPPIVGIAADVTLVCADTGGEVNFSDASLGVATSWSWTFPGGTPATSTMQNPTVSYGTTGFYDVTLTVSNTDGTDTQTFTNYIEVVTGAACPTCTSYTATDVPITIPETVATGTSTLNVTGGTSNITDVNVINVTGLHTYVSDLTFTLTSPSGTTVELLSGVCGTDDNFDVGFDNSAPAGAIPCPPTGGGTYQPNGNLDDFLGEAADGDWVLTYSDGFNQDGGSIDGWAIEICGTGGNVSCTLSFTTNGGNDLCGNGTASATVNPTGGTGPYTYFWDAAANNQTGQTAFSLTAGTYSVSVTDASNCTDVAMVTVSGTQPIVIDVVETTPISCPGAADGAITANVTGGSGQGTYAFDWDNTVDIQSPFALAAGTYNLTLTDGNGCTQLATYTLADPTPILTSFTTTPEDCGSKNGEATVTPSGGSGSGYTYMWDGAASSQTTQTAINLESGTYMVSVTDGNNCTTTATVTVAGANGPAITGTSTLATCGGGANGTATANANDGTAPYTYVWDATAAGQMTETATNLIAGSYGVTVTDATGCVTAAVITVSDDCGTCALTASFAQQNELCANACDGTAEIFPSNGTAPYGIIWDDGTTTAVNNGLCAGTYSVTVADLSGCFSINSVTIGGPAAITATTSSTAMTCAGNDGTATVSASGGTGNLSYQWDASAASQITSTAINLANGSYDVVLTDGNGCMITETVLVGNGCSCSVAVATSSTNATCGAASGTATANTAGATAPISYEWSNAGTTQTINSLTPGTYSVTVTDANNCPATAAVTVGDSGTLAAQMSSTNLTCNGDFSGSVTVTNAGSFDYVWNTNETTATIENLEAGTYTVTVSQGSCVDIQTVTVTEPSVITMNLISNDNFCTENGGSINASVFGGVQPYTYEWSNNASGPGIGGLATGNYTLTLTDGGGCVMIETTAIYSEADGPVLSTAQTNVSCMGDNDGAIDLTVIGGMPPYTYNWGNGINVEDLNGLTPGAYTVQVMDSNGCLAVTSVNISEPSGMTLNFNTTPADDGQSNGSAGVNVAGGVPPFAYQWDNGQTTQTATDLPVGTYTVFITDGNGCTTQGTVEVPLYTGIVNLENLIGFELNPNPSDGRFVVEIDFETREQGNLQIFNVLGQEFYRKELNGTNFNIPVDISNEAGGIYFAIIKTQKGNAVKRFVITE